MGRSPCCAKEGLNRGAWTAMEDKILTDYIKEHGEGKWRNLPKKAGLKRCGKSCRLRWLNYLRPDIKRGNITRDEEELIIRLHKLLGNRWSLIAGRLPGRTDNEIKNYWNTNIGKKIMQGHPSSNPDEKPRIQSTGKLNSVLEQSVRPQSLPIHDGPGVIHAKPSRCTKVFLPAEPQKADQVDTELPLQVGPPMVEDSGNEKGVGLQSSSPFMAAKDDSSDFMLDFEMDASFLSEFLNSDFTRICEFDEGFEGESNTNNSTITHPSTTAIETPLLNEEMLQNPNLFSIDSFLDCEMDWFC